MKTLEIRMPRGDTNSKIFRLIGLDGSPFPIVPDEIYFTVKTNASDREYKFQKRLSDGGITFVEAGKYRIAINPEDTDNLLFGSYDFDFEIVKEGVLKRTFCGKFILDKEVTHRHNEGE